MGRDDRSRRWRLPHGVLRPAPRARAAERRRAARARRDARPVLPRAGRHLRLRRRGASVPAGRRAPCAGRRRVGARGARRGAARPRSGSVPGRRLRSAAGDRRRGDPAQRRRLVDELPARRARHQPAERCPRARLRHRPGPGQPGRLARARGQRPGAQRRQLRPVQPPRDGADVPRALRRSADPAGRRLPAPSARRADRGGTDGRRRADRGRADARGVQQRLLRALSSGPHDGGGAGRGP